MKRFLILTSSLALLFLSNCEEPNGSPVIGDLSASNLNPYTLEKVVLTASATDPENDVLTVSWEASAGSFSGATDSDTVTWVAPAAATAATITVTYSDGSNSVSQSIDLTVGDLPQLAYVGSATCGDCHVDIYGTFIESGHPYKFNLVHNGVAPTYPSFVTNYVTELPTGVSSWNDVAGVIGGYGWKERFVGIDGQIIGTGGSAVSAGTGQNQHNFFEGYDWGWVDYHPNDVKPYNYSCFKCHTTGAVETANPDSSWLKVQLDITDPNDSPLGYFEYGGIQCEACHGKGSQHAVTGNTDYIDRITTSRLEGVKNDVVALCGDCHTRNADRSIAVSGGKIKHHEQYDEFISTAHYQDGGLTCISCHDPHKRVEWEGDGIKTACTSCHTDAKYQVTGSMSYLECVDCHMPFAAKSGISRGTYVGDINSHLFSISTDTTWNMISDDGATVRVDSNGKSHLSLEFACYGCHDDGNGNGGHETSPGNRVAYSAKSKTDLYNRALTIHSSTVAAK